MLDNILYGSREQSYINFFFTKLLSLIFMRHKNQFLELLHKICFFLKIHFITCFLPYFDYKNNQNRNYYFDFL